MIQINAAARHPPRSSRSKLLNAFWARRFVAGSPAWWLGAIPNAAAACNSVIRSMSPMKRSLAAFAIAASQFAPVANANDALEAKVRTYVPVVSLAKVCDITINDATSVDHRAMLQAVKSDPNDNYGDY